MNIKKHIRKAIFATIILAPTLAQAQYNVGLPDIGTDQTNIGSYIESIYNTALGISGIAAVAMIVVGAIYYTLSGGSPDKKSEGKDYITSAIWGLVLLLGAFLVLNTINPQLTRLSAPSGGAGEEQAQQEAASQSSTSTEAIEQACEVTQQQCEAIYPEANMSSTFQKPEEETNEVEVPIFSCNSEDECQDSIETEVMTVYPQEGRESGNSFTVSAEVACRTDSSGETVADCTCAVTKLSNARVDEPWVPDEDVDGSVPGTGETANLDFQACN